MPTYLYQFTYTAESIAAQMKNPQDRMETAARPVIESIGGKFLGGGFPFGEYDGAVMMEAPDDASAAAVALAVAAGGAVKAGKTTKLLSGAEWVASLRKAKTVAKVYKP